MKKLIFACAVTSILVGFMLVLGAIGASDLGSMGFTPTIIRSAIGLSLIWGGFKVIA